MKTTILSLLALAGLALAAPSVQAQTPEAFAAARAARPPEPLPPGPPPNSQYRLGPDSMPQPGVPKGEVRGPYVIPSQVFPGTQHTYWVYVPAQYDPSKAASLMIFQDGQGFLDPEGDLRTTNVLDNLIYRREIPVMIAVFINPGHRVIEVGPSSLGYEVSVEAASRRRMDHG